MTADCLKSLTVTDLPLHLISYVRWQWQSFITGYIGAWMLSIVRLITVICGLVKCNCWILVAVYLGIPVAFMIMVMGYFNDVFTLQQQSSIQMIEMKSIKDIRAICWRAC